MAALAATEVKTSNVTSSSSSGLNEAKAVAGLPTKVVHENGREKAQEQQQQTSRNNNFNRQNAAIKQRQQKQQQLQYRNAKIPLIPRALHEYLFGQGSADSQMLAQMTEEADCAESRLQLPPLRAEGNLSEHFRLLGQEQFRDYEELLAEAMAIRELPPMPDQWHVGAGWTAYDGSAASSVRFPEEKLLFFDVEICMQDGKLPTMAVALSPTRWYSWCSQRLVDEQMELPDFIRPDHLIPLEDSDANGNGGRRESQLVIGHNVAFDRQFIREQYLQRESAMRFWCTMSMHIACAGMADHQRNLYEKSKLNGRDFQMANIVEEEGLEGKYKFTPEFQQFVDRWKERTCRNSLQAVLSKYCAADGAEGEEQHAPPMVLEKKWQEFFVKQDIQTIRQHSQELLAYCAADVRATFQVFQRIYPIFRNRFPHPITYCGMMEMANANLPITGNWHRFFHKCEAVSSVSKNEASHQLIRSTQELIEELDQQVDEKQAVKKYALDPWLWVSDWNRPPKHPQWPAWYFGIFQTRAAALASLEELDAKSVKLLCRQIPRIFGLCFGPYPLLFVPKFGWGFLVPSAEERDFETLPQLEEVALGDEKLQMPVRVIYEMIRRNQIIKNDVITRSSTPATSVGIFDFYRLPHPSGKPKMNVGSPFVKGNKLNFENFEEGVIFPTRFAEVLQCFLQSRSTTRFWGNYRDRFQEQLPVWLDEQAELGAIVPSVIPAGTVTRRAVHKLWLTSANPKKEIIGSDLKSMIQCTDGWFLVGADVDSQEQWIAALFGDSLHESRRAGATPFSNMLLTGNKSDRTDLHSVVAKQVGITRDQAKVLNYARLYGSGKLHAEQFLKTQGISSTVAKELTNKLFEATKGKAKNYVQLTKEGAALFKEFLTAQSKNSYQNKSPINGGYLIIDGAYFLETQHPNYHNNNLLIARFDEWLTTTRKSANSKLLFASRPLVKLYKDGYESHTFNFLSLKSNELHPRTPILKCQLSEALEPFQVYDKNKQIIKTHEMFNKMYKRTIINWFVQSSAVDFLHMLLVCMRWLCAHYDIRARFVISIHDELRYLVPEEDKYRCAQALTLSNMFVRAAISEALGIQELPRSIAFFSQVDIDTVLRKEVNIECRTPDGKLVRQGESLNIDEILEKTGGSLNKTTPR